MSTPPQDLGFGARVARGRRRLLNQDGSFNVARRGLAFLESLSLYHSLLTISWLRFNALVAAAYLAVNALFACAYLLCGPGALAGAESGSFAEAFFFSVHTLATIGYGSISPRTLPANLVVTAEALAGMLGFALATGLLFARFSRPQARILFSRQAVIAPYREISGFMFRIANQARNELTGLEATVLLTLLHGDGRRFLPLKLERATVMFFPLHWVVVHPIDESSPLHGMTERTLAGLDAEVLILLTALDDTFSQTVHARSSYKSAEIVWGARFADMFAVDEDGILTADLRRIHDVIPAPLP